MVKEQTFSLMEVKGLESSEKVDLGTLLHRDKNGNIIVKFVNGKQIKQ